MKRFLSAMAAIVMVVAFADSAKAQDWKLGVMISSNAGGGLYINDVFSNSPAEAVGLNRGNVILTIDGVLYNNPQTAREKIMFQSGDAVTLVYQDGGDFYEVSATLVQQTVVMTQVVTDANGKKVKKSVKKNVPVAKNLVRKKVRDPRK